jgi:hypothetical protein
MAFSVLDGRIVCATAFNAGGEIRFARKLIESRALVGADALADGARKLKDLAPRAEPVRAAAAA